MQPEILKRSEEFKEAYTQWKNSPQSKQLLKKVKAIYEASFFGNGDIRCDILRHPAYNLLVLHYTDDFETEDFIYLMDHIQEVLLGNGYFNYMSDKKRIALDGGLKQTVERHYLKPDTIFATGNTERPDRRFGNVIIEVYYNNADPQLLKLTCNYYNERNQQKEKGIDKLMEEILK